MYTSIDIQYLICDLKIWYEAALTLLAPIAQKLDSTIHCINHYAVDNAIYFRITYPLDSDLSSG